MFIGQNEIEEIFTKKYADGREYVEVSFKPEEGKTIKNQLYSQKVLDAIKTEEPIDLTTIRNNRCFPVIEEMLQVLLNNAVRFNDIDFILNRTIDSLKINQNKAIDKAWGNTMEEQTMVEAQDILMAE